MKSHYPKIYEADPQGPAITYEDFLKTTVAIRGVLDLLVLSLKEIPDGDQAEAYKQIGRRMSAEIGRQWSILTAMQYLTGQRAAKSMRHWESTFESAGLSRVRLEAVVAVANDFCANGVSGKTLSGGRDVRTAKGQQIPPETMLELAGISVEAIDEGDHADASVLIAPTGLGPDSLDKSADARLPLNPASAQVQADEIFISRISCCEDVFLQNRLTEGQRSTTSEYSARLNGAEAGLLIFEEWPRHAFVLVYEIYVLKPYRRLRVGLQLLKHAEALALEKGFSAVRLQARSLDRINVTNQALMQWYSRSGYVVEESGKDWMRKAL